MDSHWPQINSKRIREKAQEIQLYCAQKWDHMTPRAFELARLSFERLLENIAERDKYSMAASVAEDICRGRARGTTCSAQMGTGRGGQMGTARSAQ